MSLNQGEIKTILNFADSQMVVAGENGSVGKYNIVREYQYWLQVISLY